MRAVRSAALTLRAAESPQKCEHERSPLPVGEGQGEGENAALVAIPFNLFSLLDFQPDPVIAVTVLFLLSGVIAVKRNMTGDSSPHREREQFSA